MKKPSNEDHSRRLHCSKTAEVPSFYGDELMAFEGPLTVTRYQENSGQQNSAGQILFWLSVNCAKAYLTKILTWTIINTTNLK